MTNAEWIEYYRYHPSEFDSLIKFAETTLAVQDATIERLEDTVKLLGHTLTRIAEKGEGGSMAYTLAEIARAELDRVTK